MDGTSGRVGMRLAATLAIGALLATLSLGACSAAGSSGTPNPGGVGDPAKDKLAQILARGTLVGYAELDYPPQSIRVEDAVRVNPTKCLPNQLTAAEVTGFDIETTKLVANDLGVEACFVSPTWTEVTAGNWNDRFDLVYGSGAINATRMKGLWMTQPYYYIPQRFLVRADSPYQKPSDLDGKSIGTCTSCTVQAYIEGTLSIPGIELVQKVKDPKPVGFETEGPGIDALVAGDVDAFLAAEPVDAEAIKEGKPLRMLDEPAFSMYPSGFVDKGSALAEGAFAARVNEIIKAAHADGRMKELSMHWFGVDYTTQAAAFDLTVLGQVIQ